MLPLKKRRTHTAIMYLYHILGGRVTEPETLEKIGLRVPRQGSRGMHTSHLTTTRTNILKFSILNSAMNQYNCIISKYPHLDMFHLGRQKFRNRLLEILGENENDDA